MKTTLSFVMLSLIASSSVFAAPQPGLYIKKDNSPLTNPGRGAVNCAVVVHQANENAAEISYVDDPRFYPYGSCGTELNRHLMGVVWGEEDENGNPTLSMGGEYVYNLVTFPASDLSEVASKGGSELWRGVFVYTGGREQIGSRKGCALIPRTFLEGNLSGVQMIHVHDPRNLPAKTCSVHGRLEVMDLDISNRGEFGHYEAIYNAMTPHLAN